MRIFKYLLSIWTAVVAYTLLSFMGGPKGMSAYNYLLAEKEQQLANISKLEMINEDLEKNRNNLLYDYDTLLVHARRMGYGREDERFVRIVGLSAQTGLGNIKTAPAVTGNVYIAQNPVSFQDKSIKIAAICAGFVVFAFLLMLEIIDKKVKE